MRREQSARLVSQVEGTEEHKCSDLNFPYLPPNPGVHDLRRAHTG